MSKRISELPAATAITGAELVPVVQSGVTKQSTANAMQQVVIQVACSDMGTAIVADTDVAYVRAPRAFTLTAVRASLFGAASSGTFTIDINKNGTTVLSTKLTLDATEKTSLTAATAAVISVSAVASDDILTIDIDDDAAGDALGLIVTLIGTPT